MNEQFDRRNFLKMSGAMLAAGTAGCATGITGSAVAGTSAAVMTGIKAPIPKAKGPRLVVVGAGTSGMTIAAHAKKNYPNFDVVVIDKRDMYSSCFNSNLWYVGIINMEFLADHSFLDAAVNNKYTFLNATVTGLDRASRTLVTSEGEVNYDFLVLAPGISYDYDKIGVKDVETMTALRQMYPGGFISPMEHVTLKRKIQEFEGGVFVQSVPGGNYRCLPGPYERACLMASWIKKNKLKGKVVILDANPEVTIKKQGFHAAFDELYKGIIEYKPGMAITGVDVEKKTIKTEFDSVQFDDASIYANVRGNTLIEQLGLMAPSTKSGQKEADVDVRFYNYIGDPHVYVTGDSRPHPYSKSANTSNTEGQFVAKVLAARAQGKEIAWESPETVCYSMTNAFPPEAIKVDAKYTYDPVKDAITGFSPDTKTWEVRDQAMGRAYLEWAQGIYRDMFG
ncbi:MAG: FAD-dependent oxidoreductase [Gallionellaceae bacterium]|nr:FAD-dependent oxidoreductase [Gallionellaceae bacterium]MDD5366390.1 FAD-dependent oxidoreductase [Gallionellaceae bacterium]